MMMVVVTFEQILQGVESMKVEIRVFATLRRYLPELGIGEPKILDVPEGTTVGELCRLLGIPLEEVKVIMRNSRQVEPDEVLADGDRVAFIPHVGGG